MEYNIVSSSFKSKNVEKRKGFYSFNMHANKMAALSARSLDTARPTTD